MGDRNDFVVWLDSFDEEFPQNVDSMDFRLKNDRLRELLAQCLRGDYSVGADLSAMEFLKYIKQLKESHKAWAQELGRVLFVVDNFKKMSKKTEAIECLERFLENCRWIDFCRIASDQLVVGRLLILMWRKCC
ncbi:MAG: hypothetical protein JOY84_18150 [Curvibacter sp.]|nr:hypothetical protein [Curvibacter sp.]